MTRSEVVCLSLCRIHFVTCFWKQLCAEAKSNKRKLIARNCLSKWFSPAKCQVRRLWATCSRSINDTPHLRQIWLSSIFLLNNILWHIAWAHFWMLASEISLCEKEISIHEPTEGFLALLAYILWLQDKSNSISVKGIQRLLTPLMWQSTYVKRYSIEQYSNVTMELGHFLGVHWKEFGMRP